MNLAISAQQLIASSIPVQLLEEHAEAQPCTAHQNRRPRRVSSNLLQLGQSYTGKQRWPTMSSSEKVTSLVFQTSIELTNMPVSPSQSSHLVHALLDVTDTGLAHSKAWGQPISGQTFMNIASITVGLVHLGRLLTILASLIGRHSLFLKSRGHRDSFPIYLTPAPR